MVTFLSLSLTYVWLKEICLKLLLVTKPMSVLKSGEYWSNKSSLLQFLVLLFNSIPILFPLNFSPFKEIDLHTTIEIAIYKNSKEQEKIKERELLFSIIENKESGNDFIFVKHKSKLVKLRTNEILYIEALKDYVVIHSINIKYTIHSTMKEIERKMGKEEFLRVHRSYIVRVDKIATIEYPNLTIEKLEKKIPIGGSYKNILNKRIKQV